MYRMQRANATSADAEEGRSVKDLGNASLPDEGDERPFVIQGSGKTSCEFCSASFWPTKEALESWERHPNACHVCPECIARSPADDRTPWDEPGDPPAVPTPSEPATGRLGALAATSGPLLAEKDLAEWEGLANECPAGPWQCNGDGWVVATVVRSQDRHHVSVVQTDPLGELQELDLDGRSIDAIEAFVAQARTAVPALCAEVRRLRSEVFRYQHMAIVASQIVLDEERETEQMSAAGTLPYDWPQATILRGRYVDRIREFFEAEKAALVDGNEERRGWRR